MSCAAPFRASPAATPYARWGDWLAVIGASLVLLACLFQATVIAGALRLDGRARIAAASLSSPPPSLAGRSIDGSSLVAIHGPLVADDARSRYPRTPIEP